MGLNIAEYFDQGFILVPIPAGQKGPSGPSAKGWQSLDHCVTNAGVAAQYNGCNWGLAHAYSRTVAIDVDDLEQARTWSADHGIDLDAYFNAPDAVQIVSGRAGRGKLLYRLPDGIDVMPGCKVKQGGHDIIDFRCGTRRQTTSQDVLPPSIHPDTGQPYQWGGAGDWHHLPILPDPLLRVWQDLQGEGSREPSGEADDSPGEVDEGEVDSALAVIDPDLGYDDWLKVGMALHDTNPDWFDKFERWSAQGEKYQGRQDVAKLWRSLGKTGVGPRITIMTLFKFAILAGWARKKPSVKEMFGIQPRPAVERIVYIKQLHKFIDTVDGFMHDPGQMNMMLHGGPKSPPWTQGFFNGAKLGKEIFLSLTYRPEAPPVVSGRYYNSWQPGSLVPQPGVPKPWLWLLERLLPDADERFHLLQWMAYTVQKPATKINHAILMVGPTPGQGKDTLFEPLQEALGRRNCGTVFASALGRPYNDWLKDKKLIFIQEIMDFMDKGQVSNYLKPMLASPPTTIQINQRYVDNYELPNLAHFIFFSNEETSMRVTHGDRRYFAVRIECPPLGEAAVGIYRWYEQEDGYAQVMHYLMNLDISGFDPKAPPPATRYKDELIEASRSELEIQLSLLFEDAPSHWQVFTINKVTAQLAQTPGAKQLAVTLRRLGYLPRSVKIDGNAKRLWISKELENLKNYEIANIFQNK